mmetsp:Transcript_34063/g.96581  ORF Transcript_34063/g.96581 Transcript_34063/m.96581 type:complete len:266 (+) Transcript_34063:305-1102(+)
MWGRRAGGGSGSGRGGAIARGHRRGAVAQPRACRGRRSASVGTLAGRPRLGGGGGGGLRGRRARGLRGSRGGRGGDGVGELRSLLELRRLGVRAPRRRWGKQFLDGAGTGGRHALVLRVPRGVSATHRRERCRALLRVAGPALACGLCGRRQQQQLRGRLSSRRSSEFELLRRRPRLLEPVHRCSGRPGPLCLVGDAPGAQRKGEVAGKRDRGRRCEGNRQISVLEEPCADTRVASLAQPDLGAWSLVASGVAGPAPGLPDPGCL